MRILVIDDVPSIVRGLERLLRRDGYTVDTAQDGQVALALLYECHYDLILCDLRMPALDGPSFYAVLLRQYPALQQRVIFLTGDTLCPESMTFLKQCGQPWLAKPCSAGEIRSAIAQVLSEEPG